MKAAFKPSAGCLFAALNLLILALLPFDTLRIIVFGVLALPYVWIVGHPPFPYHDKPFYVSPDGAVALAVMWSLGIYLVEALYNLWRRRSAGSRTLPRLTDSSADNGSQTEEERRR